ncbi:MAG: glycosyltransferase [Pyrinomonadaceae bacterium]
MFSDYCNFQQRSSTSETLSNIAGFTTTEEWEVIVVDNNSTDDTKRMISEMAKTFPVELRTVFESEQGKAAALNAGIRTARGQILAFTDDAARFEPDWLDQAGKGLEHFHCDYVGGKVLPIWEGDRPAWLPNRGGTHWAVIALLDYGPEPLEFGKRVPLGINMAIRRDAFTIKRSLVGHQL